MGRRRRHRGRGAGGPPRARRGLRPRRHQGLRRVAASGTSSSSTARRRPRRSACCPCPTSSAGTWSGSSRRAAGSTGGAPGAVAGHEPAGRGRRRVRLGPPVLRPARRRQRAPHRHRAHERPPRRQPRAHGDRRGPPHRHLPGAVRLRGRRRRRQPAAARRRSPTPGSTRGRSCTPSTSPPSRRASRRCPILRAELAADELVGLDRLRPFGAALYGERDPAAVLHDGAARVRTGRGDERRPRARPALRRPRRPRAGPPRRRAARPGRAYRRAIVLPDSLQRRTVAGASSATAC